MTSSSPLQILVDQKMTLDSSFLVLTRNVTDFTTMVTVQWESESSLTTHTHTVKGKDSNSDDIDLTSGATKLTHGFKDNSGDAPYHEVGFSSVYLTWSYISAFGYAEDDDWLFYPTEGKGNSSLPVGDCGQVLNTGWRVAKLGASWYGGSYSGLFYLFVNDDSGNRSRNVGGRLLYVPDDTDAPAA